jgi:hypothetical protein
MLASREAVRRLKVQSQPRQTVGEILCQKCQTQKRAVGVTQVLEHLPSKLENLNSNPSTTKKKKKE